MSQAEVARDLGVSAGTLAQWVRRAGEVASEAEPVSVEEMRRLRKRVAQLEEEREILKKAAAYFAKESK
jgi:transposase